MEKEVLIHIKGVHTMDNGNGDEPVELVVPGEYYFRNGSHYLRYEEILDDSLSPTLNYVKFSPRGMEVRKKGPVDTHMVFEQGKHNTALYTTPFGTIQMGISATSLKLLEAPHSITMEVDYALDMEEGHHVSDCTLSILAEAKNAVQAPL